MGTLWNPVPSPVFTAAGAFAAGAAAYFYVGNSTTPLIVTMDDAGLVAYPWPVVASVTGVFPPIFVPYGQYRVRIITADGNLIVDQGNIDNPAPPSGGGGIVVTADEVFQTGDPIWRLRTGTMSGFVRMNGLTLGSAASGATEYANALASPLFAFLWNNLPNSIAAVSTGRGASSTADFAANKTIVIPTMQGYLTAGVDDMGTTSAGKIQAITTCTPNGTNGIIPVSSATGIAVGQNVSINGVAVGTVTAISGTNVTISTTPTAGSGVSWRSSFFSDATQVGAAAGGPNAQPTTDQIPSHNHTLTDPGHAHTIPNAAGGGTYLGGAVWSTSGGSANNTGVSTNGLSLAATGGGNPFGILQPSRLGSWYMHL